MAKLSGKAKAKARKMKQKAKPTVSVKTPSGKTTVLSNGGSVTSYNSMEEMVNEMRDASTRGAQQLLEQCSPMNIDFSIVDEPALKTKELKLGGIKVNVHLHTDAYVLKPLGDKYGKTFVAMFQIFTKAGSMLLPMTQEEIADAGHNWRDETVIAKDDILNRAVAALRLNRSSVTLHEIAMHIAYEETAPDSGKSYYDGIDGYAIYQVWD